MMAKTLPPKNSNKKIVSFSLLWLDDSVLIALTTAALFAQGRFHGNHNYLSSSSSADAGVGSNKTQTAAAHPELAHERTQGNASTTNRDIYLSPGREQ